MFEPQDNNSMPSLQQYLASTRKLVFTKPGPPTRTTTTTTTTTTTGKSVLVMGNPSADLDSFISAVVTSYFYTLKSQQEAESESKRTNYIPILNLPSVPASELWRLRPEFGVAVRLALGEAPDRIGQGGGEQGKTPVLESLITIADIKADEESTLHKLFTHTHTHSHTHIQSDGYGGTSDEKQKQALFLVDHNSPSIPGLSDEDIDSRFRVTGCIDHHVGEKYVSGDADPRIITTGIGSCTSLVVQHLRDHKMWPSLPSYSSSTPPSSSSSSSTIPNAQAQHELSKLALAPILIDTANLKATGDKCSDTDRAMVTFLQDSLSRTSQRQQQQQLSSIAGATHWSRDAFYSAISAAKAHSLDLLTMPEILDRDYKAWTERDVNIGISSLVRPLAWLVRHAGSSVEAFLDAMESFARAPERELGVLCLLTPGGGEGAKGKEVLIVAFKHSGDDANNDDVVKGVVEGFEAKAGGELKLSEWSEDAKLVEAMEARFGSGRYKVWWMQDTSKSRKQVGPLLREVVRGS